MQPALLFSLVAAAYLLLAGGPRWTLAPLAALATLGVLVAPRATFTFPAATRSLDIALLALAAGIGVQLIPAPAALIAVISPHTPTLTSALHFAGSSAAWQTLSIDPKATATSLATLLLAIVAFWVARSTFSAGGHTRKFFRILGFFGALAAIVALTQKAVSPRLLMGLIEPEARNASPLGPFLNRNHFGAWLLMNAAVTVGYLVAHLHIHPAYREGARAAAKRFIGTGALLTGVSAVVMIGTLLMTLSRSAAAGLGTGALVGGWLGRPRLRFDRTTMPTILTGSGIALLLLVSFIDIEGWFSRLQMSVGIGTDEFDRLTIWRESLPIIRDFPLTGTGAGTYGRAMGQYQQSRVWVGSMQQWAHFNTAHSHYVQLAVEGGLLLAVPAIAAAALLIKLGLRAIRSDKGQVVWMRIGAAAGLAGIAAQSIWEVALTMPANAILAAVLAGLLLQRRGSSRPPTDPSWAPDVQSRRAQ